MESSKAGKLRTLGLAVAIPLAIVGAERALQGAVAQIKVWQDGDVLSAKDLNANFAALATGAALPPKTVVNAYLTSIDVSTYFDTTGLGMTTGPYAGWALCNGKNGTPDLNGRFVRVNNAVSGAMGGSDTLVHTHAIDHDHAAFTSATEAAHTHGTPAHQHLVPIGFDSFNNYFFTAGADNNPAYGSTVVMANHASGSTGTYMTALTRQAYTDNSGAATTGVGSAHAHAVDVPPFAGMSGPPSVAENRPAYLELTALMRL